MEMTITQQAVWVFSGDSYQGKWAPCGVVQTQVNETFGNGMFPIFFSGTWRDYRHNVSLYRDVGRSQM